MKALKNTFLFLILLTIGLSSCNGPGRKIAKIDDQLTTIEKDPSTTNDEDWKALEASFAELEADLKINRKDYTDEQLKEIGRLQGRYTRIAIKMGLRDFRRGLEEILKKTEGFLEGLTGEDSLDLGLWHCLVAE